MTEWSDDAQQFYERSIGEITNGQDIAARPSALYVTSNLELVGDGGGWVEVDYGVGGNVTQLTVHGECTSGSNAEEHGTGRVEDLSGNWVCETEQHFEYRWDELNRIVEARRWDRTGGYSSASGWTFEARQRYRYDGANQRTVKESFDTSLGDSRVALYVYPGDFERRGVLRGSLAYETPSTGYDTETQYLVAGARLVWDHAPISWPGGLDRNRRLTMGVTDLIGTTAASVDLLSGELLEVSTYYPNGARETLRTNAGAAVPLEPMGFTGKEADEDVGLVYFGERYLLARLGRWASPDPLHVHASGGGEALNSYHYVGGNLLQARDPLGLEIECSGHCDASNVGTPGDSGFEIYDDGVHVMHGENIFDADGHAIGATYDLRPALNYIPPLTSDIATNPATAARYAHERRVIERYVPRVERASAASRALGAVRDVGADVIGAGGEVGVLPEILAGLRALPSALRSAGSVVERGLAAFVTTGVPWAHFHRVHREPRAHLQERCALGC